MSEEINHTVFINVKSGKVVIADDLSQYIDVSEPSSVSGILEYADFFATIGMFFPYLGNTTQKVRYNKLKNPVITFEKTQDEGDNILEIDNRFASIIDYDLLKKLINNDKAFNELIKDYCIVFEVKNGKYKGNINVSQCGIYNATLEYFSEH